MSITSESSLEEIAALVSESLQDAGIDAVLGGGGAVTIYSENEYMSTDLDFITTERNKKITPVIKKLGFVSQGREYTHPDSKFFVEFPSGPLAFGDRYIDNDDATTIRTNFGNIRIITPTQCLMDRISWVVHGNDLQSLDQAISVARHQEIDWKEFSSWAEAEGIELDLLERLKSEHKKY